MKLMQNQIDVIEVLTGTEGLDNEIARKIAIETNGDLGKARRAVSDYKLSVRNRNNTTVGDE